MLSTATPRSWATLLRLKSFVTILPFILRASSMSFRSTSRISGKSVSTICTSHPGHLLDLLEDVQTAAAAVALQGVRGVGHLLQLAQHELRHHQRAVEEAGLADVGDAAVDDDGGVEHLVLVEARVVLERGDDARGLEPLALARPQHDAHVDEEDDEQDVDEVLGHEVEALHHAPEQVGAEQAGDAAHERAHQLMGGNAAGGSARGR